MTLKKKKTILTSNPLITGTLMLTCAGFITRIIGFFNRIYLAQLIGAREIGIYQLIFPVYMIAFSFCCHGIELAVSQMTASFSGKQIKDCQTPDNSSFQYRKLVSTACTFSLIASLLFAAVIYLYADNISIYLLKEESCAICLRLMAPVLPFTAVRCCIHGYYIGKSKTFVPSAGQLVEQLVRIFFIWLVAASYKDVRNFTASLAVCGMVIGEIAGTIYTYISYKISCHNAKEKKHSQTSNSFLPFGRELLKRAFPLTVSKLSVTLVAALETVLIPIMLTRYYNDQNLALSLYGVLTGMALPFVMFPSTLTNSLSLMLLPAISQAHSAKNKTKIRLIIEKTVKLCLFIGFTAFLVFFFFGKKLGLIIYHNQSAGDFLFILSFLCPFLYLSASGSSILNGAGLMKHSLFYNLSGLLTRIIFILFAIPCMGIQGYLFGLLASYLLSVLLQMLKIYKSLLK
ncbi:MAG: polysaccharide biosynthesis protein [Lachnospiraceae bacterium]|nr:polysaccharide biosynthesis protein [Lachnospiraceae bacterium]